MTSKVLLNISKQQELGNGAKCRESSPKKSIFRVSRQFGNGTAQIIQAEFKNYSFFFVLFIEGPRSRSYRRTAALRLIVQPCYEDDGDVFSAFPFNGAPVELN
jgi:hypothetical protein